MTRHPKRAEQWNRLVVQIAWIHLGVMDRQAVREVAKISEELGRQRLLSASRSAECRQISDMSSRQVHIHDWRLHCGEGYTCAGCYGSACLAQCFRKGAMVSIGMGKIVVEFFSAATSTRVCRYRS